MRAPLVATQCLRQLMPVAMLAFAPAPVAAQDLPEQLTIVYGGSGGTAFRRDCPSHYVATGLRGRADKFIDAVGLLCAPVLSDGTLGPTTTSGTLTGGGGGTVYLRQCSAGRVLVIAPLYASQMAFTPSQWIYDMTIGCRTWDKTTRTYGGTTSWLSAVTNNNPARFDQTLACTSNRQPVVAIRGRSGIYVDALGLICNEP